MQDFKKWKKEGSLPLSIQTTLDHNVPNNVSMWSLIPFIGASLRIFAATFIRDYTLGFCLLVVLLAGFGSMITLAWKNEHLSKYFFSYLEAFEKTWLLSKMFCRSHQWSYENMTIFFVGGNFWLLTQTHYTWLVYSSFLCFFIIQFWECFEHVHIFFDFPTTGA